MSLLFRCSVRCVSLCFLLAGCGGASASPPEGRTANGGTGGAGGQPPGGGAGASGAPAGLGGVGGGAGSGAAGGSSGAGGGADAGGGGAAPGGGGGSGGASGESGAPGCSAAVPSGACPGKRTCVEGACLAPADPTAPTPAVAAPVALFDKIWQTLNEKYGAFSVKTVSWPAVKLKYDALLEDPANAKDASWLIVQAVGEIRDGHTGAIAQDFCRAYLGQNESDTNTGVCVTEAGGKPLVSWLSPDAPSAVRPGDELVALDGRAAEDVIADLARQPSCAFLTSTDAQSRAIRVASMLWRVPGDHAATFRHADGTTEEVPLPIQSAPPGLRKCNDRVGVGALDAYGGNVGGKLLEGDVYYVYLPEFGALDASHMLVAQPAIDGLRAAFTEASHHRAAVLDLRSNPGGIPAVYEALASWLYPAPEVVYRCKFKIGPGPTDFTPLSLGMSTPDPTLSFGKPLALLTNARSFSAADFTTGFLHFTHRVRSFGAPDGGGYGDGASLKIDENWSLGYNDARCEDPDGNPLEGHPPPVDVPVEYSAGDLAAGIDTVIEAARAWAATATYP